MTSRALVSRAIPLALLLSLAMQLGGRRSLADAEPLQAPLFRPGDSGCASFRIPALLAGPGKVVLAFAEGRKGGLSDSGDIDLVLRRSLDGGETWGAIQVVLDDGPNTVGNPCPVLDQSTGTIWLPFTKNLGADTERAIMERTSKRSREAWIMRSDDAGATWSEPAEITASVKREDWTWYATGPGCGIQLKSGRLLIPCDHALAGSKAYRSHVIYSDDHGKSWALGGSPGEKTNECQAIERSDGAVLLNMRSYEGGHRRAVSLSADGGMTWSPPRLDDSLLEPVCQAAMIRIDGEGEGRRIVLFSNPASVKREKMTVRRSRDDGETWPDARELWPGPAAYSSLARLPDGSIACLYERGEKIPYESIVLARFSLDWLAQGKEAVGAPAAP